VALAHELPDVQLAATTHLGRAGVADVRVVRPHDHPGAAAVTVQVREQMVERVGHVPVALVPGAGAVTEHRAVVLLGGRHDRGVLLGEEILVLGRHAVAREILAGATAQLHELLDHVPAARLVHAEQHRLAVPRGIAGVRLQALVPRTCAPGRLRILRVEVADHGLHRGAEAVEIEAVEPSPAGGVVATLVERAQPARRPARAVRRSRAAPRSAGAPARAARRSPRAPRPAG